VLTVSRVLTTKIALILLEIKRLQQQQQQHQQTQLRKETIHLDNNLDKECRTTKLLNILINSNKEISKDKIITDQWHEKYRYETSYFKLELEVFFDLFEKSLNVCM